MFIRYILNIFKTETILLGRWNRKDPNKYIDWGNSDNCYNNYKNNK